MKISTRIEAPINADIPCILELIAHRERETVPTSRTTRTGANI
jgi:hypothetical protein